VSAPLHPNLARIAAAYDDVVSRASRGEISAAQARAEVLHLVARDDTGVLWSIDPSSGKWMRRKFNGEMVFDTPPTYGLATPTAHDLTREPTGTFNPDSRLMFYEVDEELLLPPTSLQGATRRLVDTPASRRQARWPSTTVVIAVIAAVVVAVLVLTA
jgi:hypothetical protein